MKGKRANRRHRQSGKVQSQAQPQPGFAEQSAIDASAAASDPAKIESSLSVAFESFVEHHEARDKWRNRRDNITLIFVILTFFGIAIQDWIIHNSDETFSETLSTQKDSNQRQLRAYVVPTGQNNIYLYEDDEAIKEAKTGHEISSLRSYKISIKIKNGGLTPAYNVTYAINSLLGGLTDHDKIIDEGLAKYFLETLRTPTRDLLPTGEMETAKVFRLSSHDFEEVFSGKKYIFVWLTAKYRDSFGRCQTSLAMLRSSLSVQGALVLTELLDAASDPAAKCDNNPEGYGKRSIQSTSGRQE